jgi:hypothetical protein
MPPHTARRLCLIGLATLVVSVFSWSQNSAAPPPPTPPKACDSGDSLAAVACRARAERASHAKKVLTDDDLEPAAGPLPPLKMYGAENGDEIVAAIAEYKKTHTPEQTENAVRLWYDKYDQELAAAIRDNLDIKDLRQANLANGYELCQESQDYRHCQSRSIAEARGERHDQVETAANNNIVTRIQHAFMNIRNGMAQHGLRYDWFKVRTTNNIDKF